MYIDGIGISGYRSFGGSIQYIGPFSKVNLFIGQNNSGKSNILRFLAEHYKTALNGVHQNTTLEFAPLDKPQHSDVENVYVAFPLFPNRDVKLFLFEKWREKKAKAEFLERILQADVFCQGSGIPWIPINSHWGNNVSSEFPIVSAKRILEEQVLLQHEWGGLRYKLINPNGNDTLERSISQIINWIKTNIVFPNPTITLIPAIRRVEKSENIVKEDDFSGLGIIKRLSDLQNWDYDTQEKRELFKQINVFLKEVTGADDARIQIPDAKDKITVIMDGKTLPLDSLGTGIHEVVILASAATVLQNQVLCIEEPELHLHPTLQKKLIKYLQENTNNQYFITTHSAHLLNTIGVSVFHVQLQGGNSIVTSVNGDKQKSEICFDLGYKASDLLQANCIIWVEGPSDRIYLNHWIHAVDPDLSEGSHYSIMFYGGRLLSHLTANDPDVDDFISLRRMNQNICIVIDSDRSASGEAMNDTKRRIRDEFDEGSGFAWVTKGREIENYINAESLEQAVISTHKATGLVNKKQYDNCLKKYRTKTGISKYPADKVKVAREITKSKANLDMLDLKPQIKKLIKFIKKVNAL